MSSAADVAPTATPPRAWLDFVSPGEGVQGLHLAFGEPLCELRARQLDEVRSVIDAAYAHALAGRWVLGFVRYEAAPAFDAAATVCAHGGSPLLAWFAVFAAPWPQPPAAAAPEGAPVLDWPQGLSRPVFDDQIERIHEAIRQGQVYQVNLTRTLATGWAADAHKGLAADSTESGLATSPAASLQALFEALRRAQPQAYAAWLDAGEEQVLSVSPELFFHWEQGRILCRPMKGTAARGATPQEDAEQAQRLAETEKERAENLMIVDLIRNDLSRLALPHSVKVPQLFATTAWPTVWQMTSDVVAQTRPGLKLSDVFAALFPCGSVTGAPKWQAMKLIAELEEQPRGVYCGAVGVIRPGGAATFNVPIRTLTVSGATASCGIGSGITIDANAQGEWEEWCSKRVFLDRASRPFELLETLGWADGQFCHLNAHLARMQAAAHHFGYAWQEADARKALELCAAQARPQAGEWLRLRLSSNARGQFKAQAELLKPVHGPVRIRLAAQAMQGVSSDFVRFKTTRRAHYDAFTPSDPEVFDTLLFNSRGELTEFTRGNVMLRLNGRWVTPSCRSGLLPGVGRALALQAGAPDGTPISEEVIGVEALDQASELAFVNSLRGWIPCECTGARGG